jgi:hypothetical protein
MNTSVPSPHPNGFGQFSFENLIFNHHIAAAELIHLASINRTRSAHGVMSRPPGSPRFSSTGRASCSRVNTPLGRAGHGVTYVVLDDASSAPVSCWGPVDGVILSWRSISSRSLGATFSYSSESFSPNQGWKEQLALIDRLATHHGRPPSLNKRNHDSSI